MELLILFGKIICHNIFEYASFLNDIHIYFLRILLFLKLGLLRFLLDSTISKTFITMLRFFLKPERKESRFQIEG